jgi:hypothetical protein
MAKPKNPNPSGRFVTRHATSSTTPTARKPAIVPHRPTALGNTPPSSSRRTTRCRRTASIATAKMAITLKNNDPPRTEMNAKQAAR